MVRESCKKYFKVVNNFFLISAAGVQDSFMDSIMMIFSQMMGGVKQFTSMIPGLSSMIPKTPMLPGFAGPTPNST